MEEINWFLSCCVAWNLIKFPTIGNNSSRNYIIKINKIDALTLCCIIVCGVNREVEVYLLCIEINRNQYQNIVTHSFPVYQLNASKLVAMSNTNIECDHSDHNSSQSLMAITWINFSYQYFANQYVSFKRDWDGQIILVGSIIETLASLLWPLRNSVLWLEIKCRWLCWQNSNYFVCIDKMITLQGISQPLICKKYHILAPRKLLLFRHLFPLWYVLHPGY